ncbi:hypothetical protein SKAU_G00096620 [Synaphobranchus kaupii]|uniref:Uncharacterized protein n=1 Tax=Synaphobranchus kaupii TaxID=118154 RepID=A0A9Q1J6Q4_SYNKA|nr:hypothetical protein SKAU_G00096620 [Synaphobranchus kaupii]
MLKMKHRKGVWLDIQYPALFNQPHNALLCSVLYVQIRTFPGVQFQVIQSLELCRYTTPTVPVKCSNAPK